MSSPDQSDQNSSTSNRETARPEQDAHGEAPLANVDDDVRVDRDAVDPPPQPGDERPGSPRTKPADKGVQPTEARAGPRSRTSPSTTRQSLVFNPLIPNPTMHIPPPPPAAQNPQEQLQEPESESDALDPRRTDARPPIMDRRFSYPDTYQEAVWLLDSVGATRERECLADYAVDVPCARRRSDAEEDAEAEEVVWKRMQLEQHYSGPRDASGREPGMDGAGSEIGVSEPEALEGLESGDMTLSSPSIAALNGQADTGDATSPANDSIAPKMDNQLRKTDNTTRRAKDTHQSIVYPARVYLRQGGPRSLREEQLGEPFSLNAPRNPVRETRSEDDAGIRTRRPHPYFSAPATRKKSNKKDTIKRSKSESKRLGTH
ncbi:hypothetical protein IMZ48_11440 [Candidatus Bathyarchaeota archaeon]|nr:hypothetical protein [Candidatus Bathyarchaeota archaeon]